MVKIGLNTAETSFTIKGLNYKDKLSLNLDNLTTCLKIINSELRNR